MKPFYSLWCLIFFVLVATAAAQNPNRPRMWYQQSTAGGPLINYLGKQELTVFSVTVAKGSGVIPDGQYSIRYSKAGSPVAGQYAQRYDNGSAAVITITGGVLSETSFVLKGIAPNAPSGGWPISNGDVEEGPLVFWVHREAGALPIQTKHTWGSGYRQKVGEKDSPPPAVAVTLIQAAFTLYIGDHDPCPPRDLTFKLDLGIEAAAHESHNVDLRLVVNEQEAAAMPAYIAKGPVTMDISIAVPNVPGAFTYKWQLNGETVASGLYGCGDEIPFNIVSSIATVQADPLPDKDRDGEPDVTDPDDDGDGTPDVNEGIEPPSDPPPGTNAGPGAPVGSEGTPIIQPGTVHPQPVGGGGSGNTIGDVNVLNVQDFGEQFKWALENAGNNNGFIPTPGNGIAYPGVGWTDPAPGELSTTPIDQAKQALDDAYDTAELLKGDASTQVTAMASHKPVITSVPPPAEGVWRMNIGDLGTKSFGQSYWDVDMRPFKGAIDLFRGAVSWLLTVIAWFKFWNFFRSLVPA